jgi:hypothetical protein
LATAVQSPPTSMAQFAKDKLHASASQFWSSISSTVVTPDKKMSKDSEFSPQISLENVMRVMFGSCTTGAGAEVSVDVPDSAPASQPEKSQNTCPVPRSRSSHEEAVYLKLFIDEQIRAEDAVCHLRQQMEQRKEERNVQRQTSLTNPFQTIPGPFPVSSPNQKREISIPASKVQDSASPTEGTSQQKSVSLSFDDSISAISQQTLEEMARMYEEDVTLVRVFSDVTQQPSDPAMESWKHTQTTTNSPKPPRLFPLSLTRNRSHGTINTKGSKGARSFGTKSTLSSQTTGFASAWKRDEQKYWEEVVNEQDVKPGFGDAGNMFLKVRDTRRRSADAVSHLVRTTDVIREQEYLKTNFLTFPCRSQSETEQLPRQALLCTRVQELWSIKAQATLSLIHVGLSPQSLTLEPFRTCC